MNSQKVIAGVLIIVLVALIVMFRKEQGAPPVDTAMARVEIPSKPSPITPTRDEAAPVRMGPVEDTVDGRVPYDTGIKNDPRVQHRADGTHVFVEAIGIAKEIGAAEEGPEQDLEKLSSLLSFYRMAYNENPVAADNQSVMASLMGKNPRSLVFFPADHPALNAQGELMDRWGTPYYFHALSGKQMEIVSTGPDKLLGNEDDVIHTQRDAGDFFRGITEAPPDPLEEE